MKTLIVIPAYNEADSIELVVDNIIQNYRMYDYIIINDGSYDNTSEICKERGYDIIDLPINLGLSGAFQTGVKFAYRNGYDAVIQLDGDGQHDPSYIKGMLDLMVETGADIVIGSRFLEKAKPHSLRMFGGNIISFIIKITTRYKITDPTSGMRLYNKKMMKEFATNMNFAPEPDTISFLLKKNIAYIKEFQVSMKERLAGESYLNLKQSIKYMTLMCLSIIFIQQFRKEK